jgi:hypothetical protein
MYNTLPCFIGNVIRHFENEIYYKPSELWRTLSVVVGPGLSFPIVAQYVAFRRLTR